MTQLNYLELAKQGDANAITFLLNRSLQPKAITVKATAKNGCLEIMLESANIPNQEAAVLFIRKAITGLEAASIERVQIYGKRTGEDSPAWNQDFELAGQHSSLTSATPLEKGKPQPNLYERASLGDIEAITTVLNLALQPKNITAKCSRQDELLQLMLESDVLTNQQSLMALIRKELTNIKIEIIKNVKVYARRNSEEFPDWIEEFELKKLVEISQNVEPITGQFSDINKKQLTQTNIYRNYNQTQAKSSRSDIEITIKSTLDSALEGLKIFLLDPVGGLPSFFTSLGKQQAWRVGFVFALIYIISILFVANKIFSSFGGILYGSKLLDGFTFKLFFLGIIHFLSLFSASALTRKIFQGSGSLEGDVFIAGTSLLSPAILFILSSILGIGNIEIIAMLIILCCSYTIMILYIGCTRISKVPEKFSPVAISLILILSTWLNKIIISSIFL